MDSAVVDIETTDLAAVGGGIALVICIRPLSTNRTRTYRIDQYHYDPSPDFGVLDRQEKDLIIEVRTELGKHDLLIGHNIDGFDLNFLKTRAHRHELEWPLYPFTYDTMKAFRRTGYRTILNCVGRPSASMAMVSDFLGLEQLKTAIYPVDWWQAVWGNDHERLVAMNEIVDHCQRDVRTNSMMYDLLLKADMRAIIKRLL